MEHSIVACSALSGAVVALTIAAICTIRGNDYASSMYGMIASWLLVIAVLTM